MSSSCDRGLDPTLLSGYLDAELTQGDEQRVRLHLEDCQQCRQAFEELARLREVTMSTRFLEPGDEQWRETPRGPVSRALRGSGWALLALWAVSAAAYAGWQVLTGPEGLLVKTLVFGGVSGLVLVFASVLIDRIRDARGDRYRGVEK